MRRAMRSTWLVFFMLLLTAAPVPAWGAPPAGPAATGQAVSAGYMENVAFEKQQGRERVILTVSKLSEFTVENPPGNTVVVRLENLFVPEGLRRSLEDPSLANVIRVTPVQKTGDGRSWVLAAIELRQRVPYSVRSEGMNVLIDFNVASMAPATVPAPQKRLFPQPQAIRQEELQAAPKATPAKAAAGEAGSAKAAAAGSRISLDVQDADIKSVLRLLAEQGQVSIVYGDDVRGTVTVSIKDVPWSQALDTVLGIKGLSRMDNGRIITVLSTENFQKIKRAEEDLARNAEEERIRRERKKRDDEPLITRIVPIKYRLLKDVFKSKIEIKRDVLLGGVKETAAGTASLKRATPLSVDETKTRTVSVEGAGDFIQLLQSFLSTDSEGKQLGWIGADADTNSIIVTAVKRDLYGILDMIAKMDVPTDQIQIKANIVETTKNTARNLGIQWGGVFGQKLGNQNLFVTPGGTGGSTVPPGNVLSGGYVPGSGITGIGGQGYGVNFPAGAIGTTNPASLGLLFGTIGGNILDLQLSALQKDGKLNILSSPSLVTLDNQTASTESGEDIPFVTPATANSPATVTWKRAVLRLEITPHVVDVKNIKLTIVVKKDEADFSRLVLGQPTIIVKETKTDLVVADGETIVISGLTKQKGVTTGTGVPWFKDIPGLGWLFKGEGKSEDMEETLIFITPSIMKAPEAVGIQTGPWKP